MLTEHGSVTFTERASVYISACTEHGSAGVDFLRSQSGRFLGTVAGKPCY